MLPKADWQERTQPAPKQEMTRVLLGHPGMAVYITKPLMVKEDDPSDDFLRNETNAAMILAGAQAVIGQIAIQKTALFEQGPKSDRPLNMAVAGLKDAIKLVYSMPDDPEWNGPDGAVNAAHRSVGELDEVERSHYYNFESKKYDVMADIFETRLDQEIHSFQDYVGAYIDGQLAQKTRIKS